MRNIFFWTTASILDLLPFQPSFNIHSLSIDHFSANLIHTEVQDRKAGRILFHGSSIIRNQTGLDNRIVYTLIDPSDVNVSKTCPAQDPCVLELSKSLFLQNNTQIKCTAQTTS